MICSNACVLLCDVRTVLVSPIISRGPPVSSGEDRGGSALALDGSEVFAMRMDHFQGKLFGADDDEVLLDRLEGYLACHEKAAGRKTWFGHIELPDETRAKVVPGVRYRLVLNDGRYAYIFADVHQGNQPGRYIAEFQVTGGFLGKKTLGAP
jgi:hypothetical protein